MTEPQRFIELGRVSASLLHQISNPLAAAMLHLELDDRKLPHIKRARRDLELVTRYVEAARRQVRGQQVCTSFSIQAQLNQIKQVTTPMARKAGVRVVIGKSPIAKLYGDPVKFQHILVNLIVNAIEAYESKSGSVRLVSVKLSSQDDQLIICVRDWGKGIDPSELPNIFDPFYTTKDRSGRGLGIGLATVKQYVTQDFHGSIQASRPEDSSGAEFVVKLNT